MMNNDELEKRLGQWRPAEPPRDLMRHLRAAEPPLPVRSNRTAALGAWLLRPWPLAYAGLSAAWIMILILQLMASSLLPPSADRFSSAMQADAGSNRSSADRLFLFARNPSEEYWP